MSAPVRAPEAEAENEAPVEAPELAGAQEVAKGLANALKTARVHGSASPTSEGVVGRLHARLLQFFADHDCLTLAFAVLPDALCYKSHTVLELGTQADPVFSAMLRSGVRQFTLRDAISREELHGFIELLSSCSTDADENDLATLLWERDFDQVAYLVVESFSEDLGSPRFQERLDALLALVAAEVPVDTVRAARINEDDLRVDAPESLGSGKASDSEDDLFDVSAEVEPLAELLQKREDGALGVRLVNLFLFLFQESSDPEERAACETRLSALLTEELSKRRVESIQRASLRLRDVAFKEKGTPQGAMAEAVLGRLAETLTKLPLAYWAQESAERGRRLMSLLELMGTIVIPVAYEVAEVLLATDARNVSETVLTHLARGDASFLIRKLSASPDGAAPLCVPVLSGLHNPLAENALVEAYRRGSTATRKLVIRSLAGRREPFARSILIHALSSDDSSIRIMAYRELSTFTETGNDRRAADALFAAAEKDVVALNDKSELTEMLSAVVHFDEVRAVTFLRKLVAEAPPEAEALRVAMARALGIIHDAPVVVQILRELMRNSPSLEVHRECDLALRGMSRGSQS